MTTQPTTTKEALEPCPWCPTERRETYNTEGGIVGVIIHEAGCYFAAPERRRVLTPRGVEKWNSRVTAPIVAPQVDYKTIVESAIQDLHRARTHEPKYCCPEDEAVYDRLLTRSLIEKLTAAPASTVAPVEQSEQCVLCNHPMTVDESGYCTAMVPFTRENDQNDSAKCGCNCASSSEYAAPASPVAPKSNREPHPFQEHPLYPNYCAFAVGDEDYCKRETDNAIHQ